MPLRPAPLPPSPSPLPPDQASLWRHARLQHRLARMVLNNWPKNVDTLRLEVSLDPLGYKLHPRWGVPFASMTESSAFKRAEARAEAPLRRALDAWVKTVRMDVLAAVHPELPPASTPQEWAAWPAKVRPVGLVYAVRLNDLTAALAPVVVAPRPRARM